MLECLDAGTGALRARGAARLLVVVSAAAAVKLPAVTAAEVDDDSAAKRLPRAAADAPERAACRDRRKAARVAAGSSGRGVGRRLTGGPIAMLKDGELRRVWDSIVRGAGVVWVAMAAIAAAFWGSLEKAMSEGGAWVRGWGAACAM